MSVLFQKPTSQFIMKSLMIKDKSSKKTEDLTMYFYKTQCHDIFMTKDLSSKNKKIGMNVVPS